MATTTHHGTPTTVAHFFEDLAHTQRQLSERYRAWAARRREIAQTTRELESCTDRELWELGFSRYDIPAVARGTYRP